MRVARIIAAGLSNLEDIGGSILLFFFKAKFTYLYNYVFCDGASKSEYEFFFLTSK
jgi:hypothetical protein